MNKEWHKSNPFPEKGSEKEKEDWRLMHKDNCNCGRKLLPYRTKVRPKSV